MAQLGGKRQTIVSGASRETLHLSTETVPWIGEHVRLAGLATMADTQTTLIIRLQVVESLPQFVGPRAATQLKI